MRADLTQQEIAERTTIGVRSVNGYEAGRALIDSKALLKLRAAGFDASYVLFGTSAGDDASSAHGVPHTDYEVVG